MDSSQAVLALFAENGFIRLEPSVLQAGSIYLDLSGEEMRKRLLVVQDDAEGFFCLRPELTIPLCRAWLDAGDMQEAGLCALGPVFRKRSGQSHEFVQAGAEWLGRKDCEAADADILHLAYQACTALGAADCTITMGDMGLLNALMEALALSPALRRRVMRAIVSGNDLPGADPEAQTAYTGVLAALAGQDAGATRDLVEDILKIAGINSVGGRSAADIAQRFLARSSNPSGGLSEVQQQVLENFLGIRGDPDQAATQIRALAQLAGLDLSLSLEAFELRTGFLATKGLDISKITFTGAFARNFDYYTGMVFEIHSAELAQDKPLQDKPLAAGGRYDDLLRQLAPQAPSLPAVGCALWLERFGAGEPV
jgi:ATP phosphoribosyltransferase regulatory subunit